MYVCMYLFISDLQHLLLSSESNTNYILTKEKYNCHFPPELLTFCFRWPHYTPPHSHRSLTRLPASVFQFLCLPLTVFPDQRSLYPTVLRNEVNSEISDGRSQTARNWRQQSPSLLHQQSSATIYHLTWRHSTEDFVFMLHSMKFMKGLK